MQDRSISVEGPADLTPSAVLDIAHAGHAPVLSPRLTERLGQRRAKVLAALASGRPVYGVNTGMGALSDQRLTVAEQARHQESLMLARSVGAAPWLSRHETRAVLAVRLRTLLNPESGAGPDLCLRLAQMLAHDVLPAIPRTALGSAGEIIPLAHLAAPISGRGAVLGPAGSIAVPAGPALTAVGLAPLPLGPKEGVALIEGVPVTTALAVLCSDAARTALAQSLRVVAGEFALSGASRDALHPAQARGDDTLASVTSELLALAGAAASSRSLQPPVSFRVSGQVLAHLVRATSLLDAAVERALDGVTDSPAYVEDGDESRFLGTAGFHGYDLASHLHLLTVALAGAAELGATRLHRMLDPRITGLNAQLSPRPGPHTGLTPVHKRAVGVVHEMRRRTVPAVLGTIETSAGQEDVQSFSVEAAEECRRAVEGLTDVLACELLALHQARCLGAEPSEHTPGLTAALDEISSLLPGTAEDRFFGEDLTVIRGLLRAGWPHAGGPRRAPAP
ncbi:aromatic amino acid lyase [Streptomyces fuscigenes]|uniref:aromatic amino acid lyase n=1 Tax=Streptomyces fuscigenes TaxID=1528880 RepID=UPI001F35F890|nr:aromatic amino acid lyase [Streptomyces fuscigenes]MCF3960151.1 aromatic amino acid lyase [Streptomyces fuscigenes]